MKKALLFMLTALPALVFAQQKYVLKGRVGTINPPARVFLIYNADSRDIVDSTMIKNGVFEFAGQVNNITIARLVMDFKGTGLKSITQNPDIITLYLESGNIMVSGTDSLSNASLSGTKANEDFMRYKAAVKPAFDAKKALMAEYNAATAEEKNSKEFVESLQYKQTAIQQKANDINNQFIVANPNAYISLQILIDRMNTENYPDAAALQTQFSKLSASLRQSKTGAACQKRLDELKLVTIGAIAPDFEQPDTNGKLVKLSSFRGKYVLVDFWASWCGPCRMENPNVVEAYNNFKDKNFTILSVSLDQPGKKEDWLKAIHTDGLKWNHVSDLKFWGNSAAVLYGVRAIPQNLLIDPEGKIIAKNIFGDDLEKKLTEILAGPSPKS